MTRQTALELIRQQDINHELAAAGRITEADMRALADVWDRVRREEFTTGGGRRA